MIILTGEQKAFDTLTPFIIKTLIKLGIEEHLLTLIKNIYQNKTKITTLNPTVNITPNGEKAETSPLSSGTRTTLSALLFNIILEVLTIVVRQ